MTIKNQKGFSLLEVMVAITILLVGVLALVSLLVSTINVTRLVQNKLIAAMLVQEGIEVVRNIRDNNWHDNLDWNSGLTINGNYTVQYNSSFLTSITPPGPFLRKDANSRYQYSGGNNTIFRRTIVITNNPDGLGSTEDLKVESIVTWTEKGLPKTISAEDRLFNWK